MAIIKSHLLDLICGALRITEVAGQSSQSMSTAYSSKRAITGKSEGWSEEMSRGKRCQDKVNLDLSTCSFYFRWGVGVEAGDVDIAKRRPRNDVFEIWSVEPLSLFTFGD